MSKAQILIKNGNKWFEFSKSKTGQLDYEGIWENETLPNVEGYQEIASSNYFSPSWYIFLQDEVNNNSKIYVSPETDISDKDVYNFLVHVGPLLAAVEAKDSLLAGELYLRRQGSFEKFAQLSQYIMEPLSVEILFSLVYGKYNSVDVGLVPLVFNSAKKILKYDSSKENLDQAFMRYFKENNVTLTLSVVGTSRHSWDPISDTLDNLAASLKTEDLLGQAEKIRKAKHDFYASIECAVQAEPYNPYDENAIAVMFEDLDAKLTGNPGLEKAGYIRALAAKVIREAKPKKLSYNGKIIRLGGKDTVVQINI